MAIVFRNNATTALASDITNSATSITVTDGSKFPSITGSDYFYCTFDDGTNNEIVKVTAISGNTLTVVRAQDNTTARAFSTGDIAELRLTAAVLETFSQLDAGEITADEFIGDLRGAVIFKAQAGEAVSKGDVVYVSGITGNTPVVSKADADDSAKMPAFGLILTTASLNASTEVVTFGTISGIDTSGFSLGDTLYVSTTPGTLTATKPAGESALIQNIGKVQRAHASAGSIKVGGAGRTNDVPNLNDGNIFIGNGSNQSSTASLNTKIEEYLDGGTSTPTFSTLNVSGNTTLTGDLTVNGTTTSLNTNTLDVEDKNITLNYSTGDSSASADGSGITIQDAVNSTTDATILWDATNDRFDFSHGVTFPDNKKAIFGTGSDLEIYHDGSNSYIAESGTGSLLISGGANVKIQSPSDEDMIIATANGAVALYHNNAAKLATTSTGIDVTGEGKFTDLTNGGLVHARGLDASLFLDITSGNNAKIYYDSGDLEFKATNPTAVDSSVSMKIAQNRDISFYDDTGSTQGLFWDASTERLGIGTTSPSELLHIYNTGGAGNDANVLIEGNGSGVNAKLTIDGHASGGQLDLTYRSDTQSKTVAMKCLNDGSFRIDTLGSEAMRIDSSQNVGIGTSSPQDKLSIEGGNVSINNGSAFQVGGSVSGNTVIGTLKSESGVLTLKADSTRDVQFGSETNGTAMFIEGSNGNVGIGTSSPDTMLHISDTLGNAVIRLERNDTGIVNGDQYGAIEFEGQDINTDASGVRASIRAKATASLGQTALTFSTASNTATESERMRIAPDGSVGIGTDNPVVTLNVDSDAQNEIARFQGANAQLRIDNNTLNVINLNSGGSGDSLAISTGSSEAMRIDSSQNVGIGTTSPKSLLNLTGTGADGGILTLENDSGSLITDRKVGQIHFYSNDGSTNGTGVKADIKAIAENSIGSEIGLAFGTSGTGSATAVEAMRISANGSVGIGTTAPSAKLHVESANNYNGTNFESNPHLAIDNGTPTNHTAVLMFESSGTDASNKRSGITGGNYYSNKHGLGFFGDLASKDRSATPDMFVNSSGSVGIGTDSPSESLTINAGNIALDDNRYITWGSNTGRVKIAGNESLDDIRFNTDNSEKMRLTNTGLGIGTTSPSAKLHVSGTTNLSDHITLSRGGGQFITKNDNSQYVLISGGNSGDSGQIILGGGTNGTYTGNILFRVGTTTTGEAGRFDSSGNFGIGTTPLFGHKFSVQASTDKNFTVDDNNGTGISLNAYNNSGSNVELAIKSNIFSVHSATAERFRITNAGNVGIGTSSPDYALDVRDDANIQLKLASTTATNNARMVFAPNNVIKWNIGVNYNDNELSFYDQTTATTPVRFEQGAANNTLVVDSNSRVGIGTNAPSTKLQVFTDTGRDFKVDQSVANRTILSNSYRMVVKAGSGYDLDLDTGSAAGNITFQNNGSEVGRFDSSGNLLVGTTDDSLYNNGAGGNTGVLLKGSNGNIQVARSNGATVDLNRLDGNGQIISLRKDGVEIGSIGSYLSDRLFVGSGDTNLNFHPTGDSVYPSGGNGNTRDGAIDLGTGFSRFKDLHLSGQANVGTINGVGIKANETDFSNSILISTTGTTGTLTTAEYNTGLGYQVFDDLTSGDSNVGVGSFSLAKLTTGGSNTAVGYASLYQSTTSNFSTGIGYKAIYANTTGSYNTAVGYSALQTNTTANYNTTVGYNSLKFNTTGSNNTAVGVNAITTNTTGQKNVAVGSNTLYDNTTGLANTAIGYDALANITTHSNNTAVGVDALKTATNGPNTAVGAGALKFNTSGYDNTSVGMASLNNNTTGIRSVAVGASALNQNTEGQYNIGIGYQALYSSTTANSNTAVGYEAMKDNTTGIRNVAVGQQALANNTTANENTAVGVQALFLNTTGNNNVAIGYDCLEANTTGSNNVSIGSWAMKENETGNANIAIGRYALELNTTGANNVAIGYQALEANTTRSSLTAVGHQSLQKNTTGLANVALGYRSLQDNTTGSYNVAIGNAALSNNTTANNNTAIGYTAAQNVTTGERITAIGLGAANSVTDAASVTAVGWNCLGNANVTATGTGAYCLSALTTGGSNSAFGYYAMNATTTGQNNSAFGSNSLQQNTTGNSNTAIGFQALQDLTTASQNTALGYQAALNVTTGNNSVAIGYQTLLTATTSNNNVAIGYQALKDTTGEGNVAIGTSAATNLELSSGSTAIGHSALQAATGGVNTAIGRLALRYNTTGSNNTAVGYDCLRDNTTGDANTAVGRNALENATASDNTAIGKDAGISITTGTNNTCIGYQSDTATATSTNSITLGDANITTLRCNTQTISALSDARDKANVEDLQLGVEFIKDLRPVSFTWDRRDGSQNGVEDFGFIAQELDAVQEKHNETERLGLVLKDNPDKLEASYGKLVPMLVKAIQELSQEVEELKQKLGE